MSKQYERQPTIEAVMHAVSEEHFLTLRVSTTIDGRDIYLSVGLDEAASRTKTDSQFTLSAESLEHWLRTVEELLSAGAQRVDWTEKASDDV